MRRAERFPDWNPEKIKTIGDAYMAVGGVAPDPNGRDHAEAVAETALEMVRATVPGRVQVTEDTYGRLRGAFAFERRGEIDVKGLGRVTTYFLVEELGT